jgi:hypothetical protein
VDYRSWCLWVGPPLTRAPWRKVSSQSPDMVWCAGSIVRTTTRLPISLGTCQGDWRCEVLTLAGSCRLPSRLARSSLGVPRQTNPSDCCCRRKSWGISSLNWVSLSVMIVLGILKR